MMSCGEIVPLKKGLPNRTNDCYSNTLFQCLFSLDCLNSYLTHYEQTKRLCNIDLDKCEELQKEEKNKIYIINQFFKLYKEKFENKETTIKEIEKIKIIIEKGFNRDSNCTDENRPFHREKQQDISEFMIYFRDWLLQDINLIINNFSIDKQNSQQSKINIKYMTSLKKYIQDLELTEEGRLVTSCCKRQKSNIDPTNRTSHSHMTMNEKCNTLIDVFRLNFGKEEINNFKCEDCQLENQTVIKYTYIKKTPKAFYFVLNRYAFKYGVSFFKIHYVDEF